MAGVEAAQAVIAVCPLALGLLLGQSSNTTNVDARLSVYSDTDRTTVVSPFVAADAPVLGGTASAAYTADIITTASVDIRTMASPTVVHDIRHQVSAGYSHPIQGVTLAGNYIYSQENDYLSNGGTLSATRDFLEKNVTLGLGFGYQHNLVWRTGDFAGNKPFDLTSVNAIYTQVLTPKTIASLTYDFQYGNGFQASPYRFVFLEVPSDPGRPAVPENDPPIRLRNALTGKIARSLGSWASLQGDYRFYADNWGLVAHTLAARLFLEPGEAWTIRVSARGYVQNNASFYEPLYPTALTYMSNDRELSALWSMLGGLKVIYNYPARGTTMLFAVDAKVDVVYFQYENFPYLPNRVATVFEAGFNMRL